MNWQPKFFFAVLMAGLALSQTATDVELTDAQALDSIKLYSSTYTGPKAPDLAGLKAKLDAFGGIRNLQGVLHFASTEHAQAAQDYITGLVQQRELEYYRQTLGTNLETAPVYDEATPYLQFEKLYGFASLRAALAQTEDRLLTSTFTDAQIADQKTFFYIHDKTLRTILSPYVEIVIGNSYIRFSADSYTVYSTLDALVLSRNASSPRPFVLGVSIFCFRHRFAWGVRYQPVTTTKPRYRFIWFLSIFPLSAVSPYNRVSSFTFSQFLNPFTGLWQAHFVPTYANVHGRVSADYWSPCAFYHNTCKAATYFNLNYQCFDFHLLWAYHQIVVYDNTASGWIHGYHWNGFVGGFHSILP